MAQQQQRNKNRSGDWKMKDKAFAESGWRDYIEEEMVCDIAGDMLMSPERARQLLLGSGNITTMRRVKDTIQNWIRDALDRLPSKSVKDPANIKKLRKAWKDTYDALERAYAETVKAVEAEAQKGDKRMSLGGMAREGLSVGVHKVLQVRGPEVERTVRDYETGEERAIMDEGRWRIEGMPGEFGSREDAVAAFRSFALGTRWDVTEDGDIMVYGEGDNYEAMVNRRGEREDARRERWRRQEQRAGGRQVLELMRRLGVSVTFVDMMSPRERAQLSRRQQRAKGWYDPRTGRVYINLSRHSRGDDVVATFLHEVVARKGLRELFGKDFDTFLNNVFNNVSEDIRKEIVEMASRRDWDFLTATEEYLALLAQSTDFDDARNRKVWSKVINYFTDLLRKAGITLNRPLTDNELRYILWRSYNRMEQRGVMGLADDMVMRDKLDIDSVLSVADDEASTEMQRLAADAVRRESESSERPQLDENAIDELIETATAQAIPMPNPIEFSRENWDKEFPGGVLDTPLGNVKLSDGQYKKTIDLKRKDDISMIKPTLTDPDFIVSVPSEAKNGQVTERPSSYLFIKCFVGKNGEKVYFFKSVTNKKDGLEINMSNHIDRPKRVKREIKNGKLLYRKGGGAQTEQTLASASGATSQDYSRVSDGKGSENSATGQENGEKNTRQSLNGGEGGEGVRGDASQNETTSADGRRLSLNGDREERKALRESEESRKLFEATKKKFGTTKDINEAGYILPDGTMLDFSGRHWMDEGQDTSHLAGSRAVDHRDIYEVGYDKDEDETGFKTDMSDFINRGAIRVHRSGNYSRINLSMEPTAEQMKVLRRFAAGVDNVDVDFGDGNHSDHFAEYEDAWPSRVLGDIDRYFTEGIIPSGSRRYSLTKAPTFYSNAERAVENVKQEKAKAEQWKAMLTKAGGIKAGEDKWMGLSQWLDEHKGETLSKDDVLGFVRDNGIRMEEREYSEEGEYEISEILPVEHYDEKDFGYTYKNYRGDTVHSLRHGSKTFVLERDGKYIAFFKEKAQSSHDTMREAVDAINAIYENIGPRERKFVRVTDDIDETRINYTTEGLDNKREIAFVVPGVEPYQEGDTIHFGPENEGRAVMWVRFGETTDADGKRVLVIDEIQSNRHQEGKKRGYRTEEAVKEDLRLQRAVDRAQDRYDNFTRRMGDKYDGVYEDIYADMTDAERAEADRLERAVHDASEAYNNQNYNDVPAAPFEKNWHEVAMKRMLRLAAEEGFDKVAWTTGEQQAMRYDLSKQVSGIEVRRDSLDPSTRKPQKGKYGIYTYDRNGYMILEASGEMSPERIVELFGKDLGGRMLAVPDGSRETISGEGLRIGGEGMKGFYD